MKVAKYEKGSNSKDFTQKVCTVNSILFNCKAHSVLVEIAHVETLILVHKGSF